MKSAGKARNNGLYRHIRTSKEIIRNLLNDYIKYKIVNNPSSKIKIEVTFIISFFTYFRIFILLLQYLYLDLKLTKSDLLIEHAKKTYYSLNHSVPQK